jgi:hypothetical protein
MATQIINDNSCIRIINGDTPLIINKSQVKTIDVVKNQTIRIDIGAGALRNIYIKYADVTLPAGLPDVDSLRDAIKAMLDTAQNDNSSLAGNVVDVKTSVDVVKTSVDSVAKSVTDAATAQTQNLAAVKQSVDTLGAQISSVKDSVDGLGKSISNISPLMGLQSIHDEIVATGQSQATQFTSMTTALNQIKTLLDGGNDSFKEPVRIDESVPSVVYNGYLATTSQSAATTDPVWAIQRVTRNGDMFVYEWANGNKQFVNAWDNRNSTAFLAAGQ